MLCLPANLAGPLERKKFAHWYCRVIQIDGPQKAKSYCSLPHVAIIEKTILPALDAGKIVICDRFADSTRMYQGLSRGDLRMLVDELHTLMIPRDPDLTVLIDLDPKLGLSRAKARNTVEERFEDFGISLQQKMRVGFLNLAEEYAERFRVIDGLRDIDLVAADVLDVVQKHL